MRLGAFFLTGAALAASTLGAQGRPTLPWEKVQPVGWRAESGGGASGAPVPQEPSTGPVTASVTGDGSLKVHDAQGIVRLRTGLPGRPLRAWRDGGVPLPAASGRWLFPTDAPLSQGLGALQWAEDDFRPFLRGLLWILEDGEAFLAVVNPATARIVFLPLPPGRQLDLRFHSDHLEVAAGDGDPGAPRNWSISWMGILPHLLDLGPHPTPAKRGTALAPFPKE